MNDQDDVLKAKLNLETAQTPWTELQRFFAQGSVIRVDAGLDLIEVASRVARDDSEQIKAWMAQSLLAPVSTQQAKNWLAQDALLWCVVVRPLILVQDSDETEIA